MNIYCNFEEFDNWTYEEIADYFIALTIHVNYEVNYFEGLFLEFDDCCVYCN